jgi:hypothetical protein
MQTSCACKRRSCGDATWSAIWLWLKAGGCSPTAAAAAASIHFIPPLWLPCRDSFFSCAQTDRGYSGTATYVRTATALPFAAEEGFTGCAPLAASASAAGLRTRGEAQAAAAEPHPALAEHFTVEELAVRLACGVLQRWFRVALDAVLGVAAV